MSGFVGWRGPGEDGCPKRAFVFSEKPWVLSGWPGGAGLEAGFRFSEKGQVLSGRQFGQREFFAKTSGFIRLVPGVQDACCSGRAPRVCEADLLTILSGGPVAAGLGGGFVTPGAGLLNRGLA
jgi:hypothetical protein